MCGRCASIYPSHTPNASMQFRAIPAGTLFVEVLSLGHLAYGSALMCPPNTLPVGPLTSKRPQHRMCVLWSTSPFQNLCVAPMLHTFSKLSDALVIRTVAKCSQVHLILCWHPQLNSASATCRATQMIQDKGVLPPPIPPVVADYLAMLFMMSSPSKNRAPYDQ